MANVKRINVVFLYVLDLAKARKFYDYKDHSRVGAAHGEFVTDEICDRFCVLGDAEQATAKLEELESVGVDQVEERREVAPHVDGAEPHLFVRVCVGRGRRGRVCRVRGGVFK